jgi:ribosomal protein S27E
MLLKIACNSCGHAGIANSSTLPRKLQCSRCGDRRHVAPKD